MSVCAQLVLMMGLVKTFSTLDSTWFMPALRKVIGFGHLPCEQIRHYRPFVDPTTNPSQSMEIEGK